MRDFSSELDQIPGIGDKRKKRLLRSFGSITGVRQASVEELSSLCRREAGAGD